MSFFTFNSEPHRRFVLWLFTLVVLPVAGLFSIGVFLQPLSGDLTRIGFYSEREFGWHSTQVIFPNTQLDFSVLPDDSSKYYEILVLGDSFSRVRPEFQWQNYLKANTRESIGTMDINNILLSQILASPGFRNHPPKLLIMESVERELPLHLKQNNKTCKNIALDARTAVTTTAITQAISWNWESHLSGITRRLNREKKLSEINPGFVLEYLKHNLFAKVAHPQVYRLDTDRPVPFSSRNQSSLLIYDADVKKIKSWSDMGLDEMDCRIEAMRRQVEANGYTRFVLMVPPDKLTVYADFLSDQKFRHASLLSVLSDLHPELMPRFDKALITAVHSGEQDVYFPDDTHWASNGQRIAAETLIPFLKRPNE